MTPVPAKGPNGERWFMSMEDSGRAFAVYSRDHKNQTHDRLIARGGFGSGYMDSVAPGWTPRAFDGQPIEEMRANPHYYHGSLGTSGMGTILKDGADPFHWSMPPSPWGLPGTFTPDETEARARADFPAVWARIDKHLGRA